MNNPIKGKQLFMGNVFLLVLILNLLIVFVEIAGGYLSGSLALISDAIHNLGDVLALGMAWIAFRLGRKANTLKRTYGFKRAEIITALFNSSLLAGSALFIMVQAVKRFFQPGIPDPGLMLWIGIAGLFANILSVVLLHGFRKGNLNARAAYLHLLGDSLSSVIVVAGALSLQWFSLSWIDPVLSLIISLFILREGVRIIDQSLGILMQNTPRSVDLGILRDNINQFKGVKDIHHLHAWQLNDEELHIEFHIELEQDIVVSQTRILHEQICKRLKEGFGFSHITIQFEVGICQELSLLDELSRS